MEQEELDPKVIKALEALSRILVTLYLPTIDIHPTPLIGLCLLRTNVEAARALHQICSPINTDALIERLNGISRSHDLVHVFDFGETVELSKYDLGFFTNRSAGTLYIDSFRYFDSANPPYYSNYVSVVTPEAVHLVGPPADQETDEEEQLARFVRAALKRVETLREEIGRDERDITEIQANTQLLIEQIQAA